MKVKAAPPHIHIVKLRNQFTNNFISNIAYPFFSFKHFEQVTRRQNQLIFSANIAVFPLHNLNCPAGFSFLKYL